MGNVRSRTAENESRRKLIEAGTRLFGLHGFEAASTRALASEAGVNLAAIPYHFGGKEGLYRAVLEHIVALKLAEIGPALRRARQTCEDPAAGPEALAARLRETIEALVFAMFNGPDSRGCAQIMLQEQIAPTEGFRFVHDQFLMRIHATLSALLSRLSGLRLDSLELRLYVMSLMGQIFIFRVGTQSLLELVADDRLSEGHVAAISAICVKQAEALVADLSRTPRGGGL